MKVYIKHQESYSRKQLLLRSFFGLFYIGIPHLILMMFYLIWIEILEIFAIISILFTTKYPKIAFNAYVGYLRWNLRVSASLNNLVDGFPPFGPNERWEKADFDVAYPEKVTRLRLLFTLFLSSITLIPHFIILYFRSIGAIFLSIAAWFSVLINGTYPESMHKFQVGTYRLMYRISLYNSFLYFKYPEVTGEETEMDRKHLPLVDSQVIEN